MGRNIVAAPPRKPLRSAKRVEAPARAAATAAITPLNPPLGAVPPLPPKIKFLNDTAKQSPLSAVMTGLAYASQHADAVTGTGSLNVVRYGRLLKARRLVGVRGAGAAYDGLYYVKSVTHNIKHGDYKQDFTLVRNGLLSTVPRVPA